MCRRSGYLSNGKDDCSDAFADLCAVGDNLGWMSGTVMGRSHTPLSTCFWAVYLVSSQTNGMSAAQFQRQLWLSRYETAFGLLHFLPCHFLHLRDAGNAGERIDGCGSLLHGVALHLGLNNPSLRLEESNANLTPNFYIDRDIPTSLGIFNMSLRNSGFEK
jgi:hypothetical protein